LINRILIVGLGSIGTRHLHVARELLPGADIRILRHQECGTVPRLANGYFTRIEEALAFQPEAAVIASPATFHLDTAQPLANEGVHLLIEKPLSASLEDTPVLLKTCREQETVLLTGYNLRFLPSLQRFREFLKNTIIGKVISVRCEVGQYLPLWRPDTDYRQGVSARQELGGGALLELSHELDYLRWIFGEVDWISATSHRQSNLEIDVEDSVHIILGFATNTGGSQLVGTLSMDFIRHDTTRYCTAIGEQGSLRWNGLTGVVELFKPDGKGWLEIYRHQHQRNESYLAEWQHFLACITEKNSPLVSGKDGYMVLQIIEAIRLASKSGEQIHLRAQPTCEESP